MRGPATTAAGPGARRCHEARTRSETRALSQQLARQWGPFIFSLSSRTGSYARSSTPINHRHRPSSDAPWPRSTRPSRTTSPTRASAQPRETAEMFKISTPKKT